MANIKKAHVMFFASAMFALCACSTNVSQDYAVKGGKEAYSDKAAAAKIICQAQKAAKWHIENPTNTSLDIRNWEIAPFYDGLIAVSRMSGNPEYWAEVLRFGDMAGWQPGIRPYHADDHAICRAWLTTYAADTSKAYRLKPTLKVFDKVIADSKTWGGKKPFARFGGSPEYLYNWCDALYMSPGVLAQATLITGDKKYLDFADQQYRLCHKELFSPEDSLFYRDGSYIGKLNKNGKRIFWGRGEGWVMASFPSMFAAIKEGDSRRGFYLDLYKAMAEKLLSASLPDGRWGVNVADPSELAGGETSATCFIAYSLAWGVNAGILDASVYLPHLIKTWNTVTEKCVSDSGKVSYIQPVGQAPGKFGPDTSNPYGVGAYLLFSCELAKALGAEIAKADADLVKAAETIRDSNTPQAIAMLQPRRMDDAAWENNLTAFRVYGPALRNSKGLENSGIDVWFKLVEKPTLKSVYQRSFDENFNYHKKNSETYDNFKVADGVGCGGTGIWMDGKLIKAGVYERAEVLWNNPKRAGLRLTYTYSIPNKGRITELKTITLDMDSRECSVESRFGYSRKKPAAGLTVATGLQPQTKNVKVSKDPKNGSISTSENVDSKTFSMHITPDKGSAIEGFASSKCSRGAEELVLLRTDENGKIFYKFGYDLK